VSGNTLICQTIIVEWRCLLWRDCSSMSRRLGRQQPRWFPSHRGWVWCQGDVSGCGGAVWVGSARSAPHDSAATGNVQEASQVARRRVRWRPHARKARSQVDRQRCVTGPSGARRRGGPGAPPDPSQPPTSSDLEPPGAPSASAPPLIRPHPPPTNTGSTLLFCHTGARTQTQMPSENLSTCSSTRRGRCRST
jgi:hypothetical protein